MGRTEWERKLWNDMGDGGLVGNVRRAVSVRSNGCGSRRCLSEVGVNVEEETVVEIEEVGEAEEWDGCCRRKDATL